jgi:hypothetical protein
MLTKIEADQKIIEKRAEGLFVSIIFADLSGVVKLKAGLYTTLPIGAPLQRGDGQAYE